MISKWPLLNRYKTPKDGEVTLVTSEQLAKVPQMKISQVTKLLRKIGKSDSAVTKFLDTLPGDKTLNDMDVTDLINAWLNADERESEFDDEVGEGVVIGRCCCCDTILRSREVEVDRDNGIVYCDFIEGDTSDII